MIVEIPDAMIIKIPDVNVTPETEMIREDMVEKDQEIQETMIITGPQKDALGLDPEAHLSAEEEISSIELMKNAENISETGLEEECLRYKYTKKIIPTMMGKSIRRS